jgi:hypothetical protein
MADNNNSGANSGSILKAPENLLHPRDYVASGVGDAAQSRGPVNKIQSLSQEQIFNNASQGKGIAGPSVPGGPDDKKASQSSAESGTKQSFGDSVNLTDGQNSCWNGGKPYSGR